MPRVRLEVRTGTGRSVSYEVATEEFLIGGAAGCDLRVPSPNMPPVVCQITRKAESLSIRRLASGSSVLLNGAALAPNAPTPLANNDTISLAGLEIAVRTATTSYISPRLIPLDPYQAESQPQTSTNRSLDEREADLARRERELQADRVLWYRRRQEMEAELQRGSVAAVERSRSAAESQEFAVQRDVLARHRETYEAERAAETERLLTWEKNLAGREEQVAQRESELRTSREAFERDRSQLAEDHVRLERRREEIDNRDRSLDTRTAELDTRLEQLTREAGEWEDTIRLAAAEEDRLRAEAERLDRSKVELDAQTARITERSGQLEAQQAVLAVLRAKLDRTREEVEREATALAAARAREDESQEELRKRIREAEQLRAELSTVQENVTLDRQRLDERDSLLAAGLEEIRQQKESLSALEARLNEREADLDARTAEFAQQAGLLKGHLSQSFDLQARLEADRVALREREAALAQAEEARQALQEQLRRRAEDLAARAKALDEATRQAAADRAQLDQSLSATDASRQAAETQAASLRQELEARATEVERLSQQTAEREAALSRQIERLKDVGQALAAERKSMADARSQWEADRAAAEHESRRAHEELEAYRLRAVTDIDTLRSQAPELDEHAQAALDRLHAAKDVLRGHLAELNAFAARGREEMEAVRSQVRMESERLAEQSAALDQARAEHRLAVAEFRQQLVEWQGKVGEIKQALSRGESRLEARQAEVVQTARQTEVTSIHIAEQVELLRRERAEVVHKRTEMERHLADMREWYRKKLKELNRSSESARQRVADGDFPTLRLHDDQSEGVPADDNLDPGDRQLGELLRSLELVEADTLAGLWAEAGRQRRSLRQVLLASGAITLYQLALIEAGNVDGLMLGRFRVIDRLRATPRESLYRVLDPTRQDGRSSGFFLLRHLSEAEMQDAVHPDEFRQRFSAARDTPHPNLAGVIEVTEINGRPAALLEWLTGLFSADWPAHAAHPGCWLRLLAMAAEGIAAAHRSGLIHGRMTSDSFVLTPAGNLKVTGFGEPIWLSGGPIAPIEPSMASDLRDLGQAAFAWSQLASKKRVRPGKAFPAELIAIVRRLEADPESPMADTVPIDRPYEAAAELIADLQRVARETPSSDDAWEKLLRHVTENAPDGPSPLRQSA
jgi:peptidoglycan hydrolase CwlO-like protein